MKSLDYPQKTTRSSCVGCKHYAESAIRSTGFVRQRCTLGAKPMLPEFAMRAGGSCGPARKAYEPLVEQVSGTTTGTNMPTPGSGGYGHIVPMHAMPWYVEPSHSGQRSPDGLIGFTCDPLRPERYFDAMHPTVGPVHVCYDAPAIITTPTWIKLLSIGNPITWRDVAAALQIYAPLWFPSAIANIDHHGSIF